MTEQQLELLSAFFDGEAVEPTALVETLEDSGAVEALRDFARARLEISSAQVAPRPGWVAATRSALIVKDAGSFWTRWIPVPAAALAAATVMAAALGLWGWRVVQVPAHVPSREAPPEATRIIAFEPGKNWQEQSTAP